VRKRLELSLVASVGHQTDAVCQLALVCFGRDDVGHFSVRS
jgi:hypothetical protein